MKIDEIRRVLVIGAGTMGQQIGLQCAVHGYAVTLYDIAPEKLDDAMTHIKAYAAQFVDEGRLTQAEANATLSRITSTTRAEGAASQANLWQLRKANTQTMNINLTGARALTLRGSSLSRVVRISPHPINARTYPFIHLLTNLVYAKC